MRVGQVVRQGEYFADEGGFGRGKADYFPRHIHIECGKGPSSAKQVKNAQGTYVTSPQSHLYDIFYIAADTVMLKGDAGNQHTWQKTAQKLLEPSGNPDGLTTLGIGPASAGDPKTLEAMADALRLPHSEMAVLVIGPMSVGDNNTLTQKVRELELSVALSETGDGGTAPYILTTGPMSSGDEQTVSQLAKSLFLPINRLALLTIGPMSAGDVRTIQTKAEELGLNVVTKR